jgi:isocitrate lyase
MATQNRFKTGLDIAKIYSYMRKDMAEYDANASKYTITRFWHGFVAQQNMIAVKSIIKQLIKAICIYPVGWLLHYVQNLDHYRSIYA